VNNLGCRGAAPRASITHPEFVYVEFRRINATAQYLHNNPDFLQSLARERGLAIVYRSINRY